MARPILGPAAKNQMVSVRLTAHEKEVLTERYGSPSKAFRQFVHTTMSAHEADYVAKLKAQREAKANQ